MPRARLKLKSNEGLVALSMAHPEATFSVLGAWPRGDRLRALVETEDVDPGALDATVDDHESLSKLAIRRREPGGVRFEVDTPRPPDHGAMAGSGVVPPFPLRLADGWLSGELATTRSQLAAFRAELEAAGIPYDVERIETEPDEPVALLTGRQREVVEAAIEAGYYDVPRECTLTELAADIGVDKSVASRLLHRAESRVMQAEFEISE